jgi:hypothetical protein
LEKQINKPHPNLFKVIEIFQIIESNMCVDYNKQIIKGTVRMQSLKQVRKNNKIRSAIDEYKLERITFETFLVRIIAAVSEE